LTNFESTIGVSGTTSEGDDRAAWQPALEYNGFNSGENRWLAEMGQPEKISPVSLGFQLPILFKCS